MNSLSWKFITPVALAGLVFTAVAEKVAVELEFNRVIVHLSASAILIVLILVVLGIFARTARRRVESGATAG